MKRMSKFLPSRRCSRQEADDHYEAVHHRFAMRMFREHAPLVRRYATNHAVAQLDLAGTFRRRPDAWRYVILEVDDPPADELSGGKEWLPAWAERRIVDDHTNFLRDVRPFAVEPETLLDLRNGQETLVKYLVEFEALGEDRGPAVEACAAFRRTLAEVAPSAFGFRLAVANGVEREAAMVEVQEPGQAYAGRYLPSTSMVALDELYFDHRDWGAELFADERIREAVAPGDGVRAGVYAIEELVGVDRR